jgi:hypothetical protein
MGELSEADLSSLGAGSFLRANNESIETPVKALRKERPRLPANIMHMAAGK